MGYFDDDPRLDQIITMAEGLKALQAKVRAVPADHRGELLLQQARGYLDLRDVILAAGPAWLPVPKAPPPKQRRALKPGPLKAGSLAARLYEFMKGRAGDEFHYGNLAEQFFGKPDNSKLVRTFRSVVRGRLTELAGKGLVEKTGKGTYRYAPGGLEKYLGRQAA